MEFALSSADVVLSATPCVEAVTFSLAAKGKHFERRPSPIFCAQAWKDQCSNLCAKHNVKRISHAYYLEDKLSARPAESSRGAGDLPPVIEGALTKPSVHKVVYHAVPSTGPHAWNGFDLQPLDWGDFDAVYGTVFADFQLRR